MTLVSLVEWAYLTGVKVSIRRSDRCVQVANQQNGGETKNLKFITVDIGKRDCKASIMS